MPLNNPILSLRVAKFNDEPVAEPTAIEFGPTGGTIGRATDCTLVLPDQQRAISRVHARVEFRGGEFLLCDMGSNPSVLNERALGGTREARLANGDRLVIGTYLLEVTIAERAAGLQGLTGTHDPLAAAKVLGGPSQGETQGDPFGLGALDPLGQPGFGEQARISSRPGYAGSESDHVSPELQAFSVPVSTPRTGAAAGAPSHSGGGIPADYDPLADALAQWEGAAGPGGAPGSVAQHHVPVPTPAPSTPAPPAAPSYAPMPAGGPTGLPASLLDAPLSGGATPFDDLLAPPSGGATPFDDLLAPSIPAAPAIVTPASSQARLEPEPRPAPLAHAQPQLQPQPQQPSSQPQSPPQPQPQPQPQSPSPSLSLSPSPTSQLHRQPPAQPHPQAEMQPQPSPPLQPRSPPSMSAPAPAPTSNAERAAAPPTGVDSATVAALLEGLGLDPSRAPNLAAPELAHLIGVMLREALRGTMAVLRSRSMTKREARMDTTLIVARDNNPLKFFPDVDSALAQMLTGRGTGYLAPSEALERAFHDIESHQMAVIVGMRAALAHVLGRFDPAAIEAQLKAQGVLDKVLSNRKAKLWDLFVEMQGEVARDAADDFQKLFGNAFNDAYEAQIDALHAARKSSKTDPADNN